MEPFSIVKAADLGGMVWFKALKTMFIMGAIIGLGFAVYLAYIKPNYNPLKTTSQNAEQIINPTYTPHATFGCASLRVLNYYREQKPAQSKVEK